MRKIPSKENVVRPTNGNKDGWPNKARSRLIKFVQQMLQPIVKQLQQILLNNLRYVEKRTPHHISRHVNEKLRNNLRYVEKRTPHHISRHVNEKLRNNRKHGVLRLFTASTLLKSARVKPFATRPSISTRLKLMRTIVGNSTSFASSVVQKTSLQSDLLIESSHRAAVRAK